MIANCGSPVTSLWLGHLHTLLTSNSWPFRSWAPPMIRGLEARHEELKQPFCPSKTTWHISGTMPPSWTLDYWNACYGREGELVSSPSFVVSAHLHMDCSCHVEEGYKGPYWGISFYCPHCIYFRSSLLHALPDHLKHVHWEVLHFSTRRPACKCSIWYNPWVAQLSHGCTLLLFSPTANIISPLLILSLYCVPSGIMRLFLPHFEHL